ncbi:MAG TPA: hypothetical protein VGQ51_05985 [Puia sp.]|jgi:hypothetical protein|nr:hypothetical protein [Puia sp.]
MFAPHSIRLTSRGRPVRLLDRHFTEWLPVWVMVIEHPEGIFVIDTGECTREHPLVFPPSHDSEAGMRLSQLKIVP